MPQYVRVAKWETYQHYKDRNPVWIKFYATVLEDPGIAVLSDAMKAHLFGIWLLASRLGNRIPADAAFIGKRINATTKVDLNALIRNGFLERIGACLQHASNPLATCATCLEVAYIEEKRGEEEEKRGEEKKTAAPHGNGSGADTPTFRAVIDAYNGAFGSTVGYTPGNLRATARAIEFGYTLAQMERVFLAVKNSETDSAQWCHDNNREYEYLIRPEHLNKRTQQITPGRVDAILNELATGRRGQ